MQNSTRTFKPPILKKEIRICMLKKNLNNFWIDARRFSLHKDSHGRTLP